MNKMVGKNGDDPAHSVIFSFFEKWEAPLRSGKVSVFFRKRFPRELPNRVYFYIGAPRMAIIGSAAVKSIELISSHHALSLAERGVISQEELSRYLRGRDSVGAIHIGDFDFFPRPACLGEITRTMVFSPPQNFQKIQSGDEQILEAIGQ
jgi:predicted transcriptional regulator